MFGRKKFKIGIVTDDTASYYEALPSTRLRVLDVINLFKSSSYIVEIFNQRQEYDLVIFMKAFSPERIQLAKTLKSKNVKVVLDVNTNIIDLVEELDDLNIFTEDKKTSIREDHKNFLEMIQLVDHVIVISPFLREQLSYHHSKVTLIHELVTNNFFDYQKKHKENQEVSLIYQGYAHKAGELNLIADVIKNLSAEFPLKLIIVSDENPNISFIKTEYFKYDNRKIPELLLSGDIKIAPRDLSIKYNLGHSINKIAYPMSLGIPAVASPVPSYLNTEAIICNSDEEWYNNLKQLISDLNYRKYIGDLSRNFVRNNISETPTREKYKYLFEYELND
jgi:hypothetical protein